MEQLIDKYIQKISGLAWFLIRTTPRSEQNAELFLKGNHIPCYLPRCNREYVNSFVGKNGKQYSYKRAPVLSPMFPGYIFAALDHDSMSTARMHRSIAQICLHVGYSEDELIEDLRKVQDFELLARENKIEVCPDIQPGARVLIKSGPLSGWEGVVERRKDQNFVFIRINSIGYSLGVECAMINCELIPS